MFLRLLIVVCVSSGAYCDFKWSPKEFLAELEKSGHKRCSEDARIVLESAKKKEFWALEMIDSWATGLPPGVLYGNTVAFGNYDECLDVQQQILSQYCIISFDIENPGDSRRRHYEWIDSNLLPGDIQYVLFEPFKNVTGMLFSSIAQTISRLA